MRHRKIKNLEERMPAYQRFIVSGAPEVKGSWNSVFGNENGIYCEIGSGKGNFLIKQTRTFRDRNYIGIEGRESVAFRALEKIERAGASNIRVVCEFINDPLEFFADGELSGIYLNFSDPWPKKRHAKKRLTHRNFLASYHKILKTGGFIEMKTDSDALFEFTLEEIEATGLFVVTEQTRDLTGSDFAAKDITTEYEEKFMAMGKKVNYIKMVK